MLHTPAQHAARLGWPTPWSPAGSRAWRASVSRAVRADLRSLWFQAASAAGLVDGPTGPSAPTGPSGPTGPIGPGGGTLAADCATNAAVPGLALACVGSLARDQLGPRSDVDLIVIHDPATASLSPAQVASLAENLWYPLWDAGVQLDHSVRTLDQCRSVASADLPAAVGLLDLAHVAGDPAVTEAAASALLADWRSATRRRLPELVRDATERGRRSGELPTLLEPDLKEARGGLRDAVLVRALVASSLAERPGGGFDAAVDTLLGVRDALATVTGRGANRLVAATGEEVAALCALAGRDELLAMVYAAGREVASAFDATLRTAERAARPARRPLTLMRFGRRSAPVVEHRDEGVALVGGDIVLDAATARAVAEDPARTVRADPALPLRLALAAARAGAPVAVRTRASLARWQAPTVPWSQVRARPGALTPGAPASAPDAQESTMLDLFVDLLDQGQALVPVWEDLDLAGLPARWLPGWEDVRNRPQHNPVHLWTVDRHMVRAAAVASELLHGSPRAWTSAQRRVLLLAALLHDIGKIPGVIGEDHAEVGAGRVGPVLASLGVGEEEVTEITLLVRHHLLLPWAATKPPGDSAVRAAVEQALGGGRLGRSRLDLARMLAEADARATGPRAWTTARAAVVERAYEALATDLG